MFHLRTLRSYLSASTRLTAKLRTQPRSLPYFLALVASLISFTQLVGVNVTLAQAAKPLPAQPAPAPASSNSVMDSAPAELKALLTQADAAANSHNLPALMKFYSDNFTHSDGLTRQTLEQAITKLWQQYPKLTYRTELKAFSKSDQGYKIDTLTAIMGTQQVKGRILKLTATLQSRQLVENQKIVQQEILTEQNMITSGEQPPTLKVSLPEQVRIGQEYNFDAIVQEPLENDLLLGTAIAETVNPKTFLNPPKADLSPLLSGGLFKVGRAPNSPTNQWLSAVVMRQSGITIVTHRLRVVAR